MKIFTWRQRIIVLLMNIGSLFLFFGMGYLFDQRLGTKPWGMVIGLILSFVVGQFFLAKVLIAEYHRTSKSE